MVGSQHRQKISGTRNEVTPLGSSPNRLLIQKHTCIRPTDNGDFIEEAFHFPAVSNKSNTRYIVVFDRRTLRKYSSMIIWMLEETAGPVSVPLPRLALGCFSKQPVPPLLLFLRPSQEFALCRV